MISIKNKLGALINNNDLRIKALNRIHAVKVCDATAA
jgi:hypothetical protein